MATSRAYHKPPTEKQKKKLSKYLSSEEELIVVTTIGPRYMWFNLIFLLLIPLGLFYISIFMLFGVINIPQLDWLKYVGLVAMLLALFKLRSTSGILRKRQANIYIVTNHRILIITGIFSRKIITAPLDRITHITVDQSVIQRMVYNTGHLMIITAGFDQREIVVEHIADPIKFKVLVEELTRNADKPQNKGNLPSRDEDIKIRAISF
ncbi:PH domain-containing protein [Candidatus Curtissbacteria bacterium]|nr:PH domain-containing protein [Candidatus Curtissbacteria bacterium]